MISKNHEPPQANECFDVSKTHDYLAVQSDNFRTIDLVQSLSDLNQVDINVTLSGPISIQGLKHLREIQNKSVFTLFSKLPPFQVVHPLLPKGNQAKTIQKPMGDQLQTQGPRAPGPGAEPKRLGRTWRREWMKPRKWFQRTRPGQRLQKTMENLGKS